MPSVLLVEDDERIRKMYAMGLSLSGFEVTDAATGGEALIRLEDTHFDVIILDMLMSGMSGLDVLRDYDVQAKSPGTKVIALTNLDNPAVKEKAAGFGITEYLTKANFEPQELAQHIQDLLAQPQPPA